MPGQPHQRPAAAARRRAALETTAEAEGCTCCQARSRADRQPDAECPRCGHLNRSHTAGPGIPEAAIDAVLVGMPATRVTRQVIRLAIKGGLNPELDPSGVRRGSYRIFVDSGGRRDCLFGAIDAGGRSGRILRAHLTHGHWGQGRWYGSVAEIRTVLKSWVALQNPRV